MDIQMPIMDGYEATKILRSLDKEIPIVALTANAMLEDIQKTNAVGMNTHLNKPIEVNKLYETLLEYISKKVDIPEDEVEDEKDETTLPKFETLDTAQGLEYLAGSKSIYLELLHNFLAKYENIEFKKMSDEELLIATHTLKGLSASIGAKKLNALVAEVDKTQDRDLLESLNSELALILDELSSKLITESDVSILDESKEELSQELRDKLFQNLKISLDSMEPDECENVIKELNKYNLSDADREIFDRITLLINEYDFDEALELLGNE